MFHVVLPEEARDAVRRPDAGPTLVGVLDMAAAENVLLTVGPPNDAAILVAVFRVAPPEEIGSLP